MSKQETLSMFERDTTVTASQLRTIGYIPATIYGRDIEPLSIQVKAHDFELALARGCRNFKLEGMGKTLETEVKQLQKNSTKGTTIHIEFYVPSGASGKKSKSGAASKKAQQPAAEETPVAATEEAVLAH